MIRMTQQDLLPKKTDLKSYLKIEEEEASQEFEDYDSSLPQDKSSLSPSIVKEDLIVVKGVGPSVAKRLTEAGIISVKQLAHTSASSLADIRGIGLTTAQKITEHAQAHIQTKKLNDFSGPEISQEKSDNSISDRLENSLATPQVKTHETEEFYLPDTEIEERNYEEGDAEIEDEIEINKANILEYEQVNETEILDIGEDYRVESEGEDIIDISTKEEKVSTEEILIQIEKQDQSNEILNFEEINVLKDSVIKELRSSDFGIINKSPEFHSCFAGVDLIAIKHQVYDVHGLIYIIPIKISKLRGSFIVKKDRTEYAPVEKNDKNFYIDRTPETYMGALKKSMMIISNNLSTEGGLLDYIGRFYDIDISIETSITHKPLFFHSGPVQYDISIEPLIICQNTVGFEEKLIPFAYQKSSNLHTIEVSQLSDFLNYISQKYYLIKEYTRQKPAYKVYYEAESRFWKDLGRVSIPFFTIPIIYILVLLFQSYSILGFFNNLTFGLLAIYSIVSSYLYLKFFQDKKEIQKEFTTPFYQRELGLDDTSLTLISEKLTPKLMEQFAYEILGKNPDSPVVARIERENANRFLTNKIIRKKVEQPDLFEREDSQTSQETPNDGASKVKNEFAEKYSSFLED